MQRIGDASNGSFLGKLFVLMRLLFAFSYPLSEELCRIFIFLQNFLVDGYEVLWYNDCNKFADCSETQRNLMKGFLNL